jgi:hypothetical protein
MRDGYLRILMEGPESFAAATGFWTDLADRCQAEEITRLLIVDRVDGRLTTAELFALSKMVAQLFLGRIIAYVDPKEQTRDDNKFGETVILNRGGNVRVFHSEAEAAPWLLAQVVPLV